MYSLPAERGPNLFRSLWPGLLVEFIHLEADLADRSALERAITCPQPEVLLHLAAQPVVSESNRDPLGTCQTNVQGSLNLLAALKPVQHPCAVVMVTTDKVYSNREWEHSYRETDRLGGYDPYGASRAAAELAIASWHSSFCCGPASYQTPHLLIATAHSGNVICCSDWAAYRIVPDAIRALTAKEPVRVRNHNAPFPGSTCLNP